jgi:hypothetical protein
MPGESALANGKLGPAKMAIETRTMRDLVNHCPANILRSDGILAPLFMAIVRCDARQMSHRSLYRVRRAY